MASKVNFYSLRKNQELDKCTCLLTRELYKLDNQVLIITQSSKIKLIDHMLWTFTQNSFLPHKIFEPNTELDTPIMLLSEKYLDNLMMFNDYKSIINNCEDPITKVKTDIEVHEFVEDFEEKKVVSRTKYTIYKKNNFVMNYREYNEQTI